MSINVFGLPVTDETVRRAFPDLMTTTITARHRAEAAVLYMHQENRMDNLSKYVYNLEPQKDKEAAGTFGMIYNATGNNLTYHSRHSWSGDLIQSFYPHLIQNGQWAGFFHWDLSLITPSREAVVYKGQNVNGSDRYFTLAWATHFDTSNRKDNQVYTSIEWVPSQRNVIEALMGRMENINFHSSNMNGCFYSGTIGTTGRAELVGIMTLAGVID